MNCELATAELVERARRGAALGGDLEAHVAACGSCRERWDAQCLLTAHLRVIREQNAALGERAHEWNKAVLMRQFDANRRRERQVRWMWAMSSAAVLVLSVVAMRDVWMRPAPVPAVPGKSVAAQAYPVREYSQEPFGPAEEAGETGFIKVPFALPTAPGETFKIIPGQQLSPADLARLGVNVDPGLTGTLTADILVGEDGLPQAVRLSDDDSEEN